MPGELNHSQAAVIATISRYGPLTRRSICRRTGLSWAAISKSVSQLQQNGYIAPDSEIEDYVRGRPPASVDLSSNPSLIGLAVRREEIQALFLGLDGTGHGEVEKIKLAPEDDPVAAANKLISRLPVDKSVAKGIGVAFPGIISLDKRVVERSLHFPSFLIRPVATELETAIPNIPIIIERNAVCDLTGLLFARELNGDTLLISMVAGVSAAIYVDNQILHGKSGNIGELGHLPTANGNIPCRCGREGCIETELGGIAWSRKWQKKRGRKEETEFPQAVSEGRSDAISILTESLDALFPALSNLLGLLCPKDIVITANLPASAANIFHNILTQKMADEGVQDIPSIRFYDISNGITARGAAGLHLLRLGGNPQYKEPISKL